MLVLSRRKDERVRIGENIVVTIVRIGSQNVRIGIQAPPDIQIIREEIDERAERTELQTA